ncbi:hypothetical protein [Limosilactobacillus viscerum]|uniref:hypothetical protein n=1 Tax=Limosilactobacillus viscerum TaxID=2993450 RepID=UPI0024B92E73|nr:hypothetical protein [Limosilactobacillus viscerum]
MSIEKDRAYAEVLRQLSTAELLDRYYKQTPELEDKVITGKINPEKLEEGPITINGVRMSVNDARDYLIMQLVKKTHPEER